MAMTIVEAAPGITGGVDTHLDNHVAAALDPLGRLVGTESFTADTAGYKALLTWLEKFGQVTKVGVEGTGSYGVGLSRFLRRKGVEVVEVNRPNRQSRRNNGKSDPLDAVEAARAAISGRASGAGKTRTVPSRPSGSWSWPSGRPDRPASRPSSRCVIWESLPLISCIPA
jgi:transposase